MNEQEVITLMKSSTTEQEWNDNCDKVKRACKGYPPFWYQAIVMSGILRRTAARWGDSGERMSDRIKGLTVTLRPDMRDDDAKHVIAAILMVKGVVDVTQHVAGHDHHIAVVTAKNAIREKIEKIVWD